MREITRLLEEIRNWRWRVLKMTDLIFLDSESSEAAKV